MIGVNIEDFMQEKDVEKHPEAWIIGYAGPIHGSYPPCPWLFYLYLETTQKYSTRASQVALVVKNSSANAGDVKRGGFHPVLGRSPGEGNGNRLQYSCLENLMDREAWWACPCDHKESDTTEATQHSCRAWLCNRATLPCHCSTQTVSLVLKGH